MKIFEIVEADKKETPASIEAKVDSAIQDEMQDLSNRHVNWQQVRQAALPLAKQASISPDGAVGKALRDWKNQHGYNDTQPTPVNKQQQNKPWAFPDKKSAPSMKTKPTSSKSSIGAKDVIDTARKAGSIKDFILKHFRKGVALDKKYR